MTSTSTNIVQHQGLDDAELAAVQELVRACEAHDGIDMRLSWGAIADSSADGPFNVLAYRDDKLIGFLNMYGVGHDEAEATGAVDPELRRQGVFRALVDAAAALCREYSTPALIFYVDRRSSTAPEALSALGAEGSFAETKMRLDDSSSVAVPETPLDVRLATLDDAATIGAILAEDVEADRSALGHIVARNIHKPMYQYYIATLDGAPVGTLNVQTLDGEKYIYGFVVDTERRGKGYGRAILARTIADLAAGGAQTVYLEVEPDNTPAVKLYRSLGFREVVTYDYYRMEV